MNFISPINYVPDSPRPIINLSTQGEEGGPVLPGTKQPWLDLGFNG